MGTSSITPYAPPTAKPSLPTFDGIVGELQFEAVTDPRETGRLTLNSFKNGQASTADRLVGHSANYVPAELQCDLLRAVRFPPACGGFGSEATLVEELLNFVKEYTTILPEYRLIAVAFMLASWCVDCFQKAPCLHIAGPNCAGVTLLRALSLLCRRSLLIGHVSLSSLAALPRDFMPTLLFAQSDISSRVMEALVASNDRAMVVATGKNPLHLYGAKAFMCEEFPTESFAMPVYVGPIRKSLRELSDRSVSALANRFQSLLLRYRFLNYFRFRDTQLQGVEIYPEISDHARSWLVISANHDSIRQTVIRALAAQSQSVADNGYTDLRCVVIEAALFFCHEPGVNEIFMRQIAETATIILRGRYDDQRITAKNAGMILRRLGFEPHRVTAGFKIVLTTPIREQIHRVALDYQVPAVQDGISRCPYCSATPSIEKRATESPSS